MTNLLRLVACLLLCVSLNSFGALYDRGNGLIYDDVLDITWLQDANYAQTSGYTGENANGLMRWADAVFWVSQLSYGGFNDWRLPSANLMNAANPCQSRDGSCDRGYNNTISELGYMFYNNLGNHGEFDINGNSYQYHGVVNSSFTDGDSGNVVSILNFQNQIYWLSEESVSYNDRVWVFNSNNGQQGENYSSNNEYSWPVHDGDIGASPVPLPAGIWLFLSGVATLGTAKLRGRNA